MSGFFSSILLLSFMDPLMLRRVMGEDAPLAPSSKMLGFAALTFLAGFGGFAGVGGVGMTLFAGLAQQSLESADQTVMFLVVLCFAIMLLPNCHRMLDGPFLTTGCLAALGYEIGLSTSDYYGYYPKLMVFGALLSLIANIQFVEGLSNRSNFSKTVGVVSVMLVLLVGWQLASGEQDSKITFESNFDGVSSQAASVSSQSDKQKLELHPLKLELNLDYWHGNILWVQDYCHHRILIATESLHSFYIEYWWDIARVQIEQFHKDHAHQISLVVNKFHINVVLINIFWSYILYMLFPSVWLLFI